jgi:hypothetical protein
MFWIALDKKSRSKTHFDLRTGTVADPSNPFIFIVQVIRFRWNGVRFINAKGTSCISATGSGNSESQLRSWRN